MVGIDVRFQLPNYISEVQEQGILDQCFDTLMELRGPNDLTVLLDSINNFLPLAHENIQQLHREMCYSVVRFDEVVTYVNRLQSNAICIGGGRLADRCYDMLRACQRFDQEMCDELFSRVREEYSILVRTLKIIYEMEAIIVSAQMRRLRNNLPK
ncbi:unnamed protein product [Linum trigynum]|uniref:Histidine-containing phosphotransfer protein n=1 Tax=Linum trigynum TaxID=586398 RepID=A0AAV2D4F2_9ROSI